jgi:hypothetical protein
MLCLIVASCTAGTRKSKPQSSSASVMVGRAGASLSFAGGTLTVPPGALSAPAELHVRSGGTLRLPAGSPLHLVGSALSVDLSGVQPTRPLRLALTVPSGAVPSRLPAQALFIATTSSLGAQPRLLAGRYDSPRRLLEADINHLSLFQATWLDASAFAQTVAKFVAQDALQLRAAKPACASKPLRLPDGGQVKFGQAPWLGATDPDIWACLSAADADRVDVAITDNRPTGFSFQVPAGVSVAHDPPTFSSTTTRLLYDVANAGLATGRELLTSTATARLRVPASGLPIHLDLVADPGLFMASAVQLALLKALPLAVGPLPTVTTAILEQTDNLDCLLTAFKTTLGQPPPLAEAVSIGYRVGDACLEQLLADPRLGLGVAGKAVVAVLGLLLAAMPIFASGVDLIGRLLGGNVVPVDVQVTLPPASPAASFDWRNTRYTVACPGIAPQPFQVPLHNGHGHASPSGDNSGGYDVDVADVVTGDITGDRRPEAAVLLVCHPSATSPNYVATEVQVFADGPHRLARLLPPAAGGGPLPPQFHDPQFRVRSGRLVTSADYWSSSDPRCCPSVQKVIVWRWDGRRFVT